MACVLGVISVGGLLGASPALGAFPGANGRIAFVSDRDGDYEVYTMNTDGSGVSQLTNNDTVDRWELWAQ